MPMLFVVRLFWLPRAKVAFMAAHETNSIANGALAEGINGVRTVQSLERQKVNFDLYDDKAWDNLKTHLTRARSTRRSWCRWSTRLTGIAMAVVIVVGGQMVLNGGLDVGVMVAFLFYIQRFFDPIRSLTMQYSVMQRAMASGQRITEVLDVPVDDHRQARRQVARRATWTARSSSGTSPSATARTCRCSRTSASRSSPARPSRWSARPARASRAACRWSTASTTSGTAQVLVGGHDVRDLTQESLGDQIAMVLQEPFLFSGTVIENIRYHKTDATRDEVVRAATGRGRARLHHGAARGLRQQARPARRQPVASASASS